MYGYHNYSYGLRIWRTNATVTSPVANVGLNLSQFFKNNRHLMPKIFVNNTALNFPVNKYYPNLINGANSRILVISRLFDTKAVTWVFFVARLSFFIISMFGLFSVINSLEFQMLPAWLALALDAFLWLSVWQHPVIIGVALLLFVIFSFFWSPVFLVTCALCSILPLILFFKNAAYGLLPIAWCYSLCVQVWLNATEECNRGKPLMSWSEVKITTSYTLVAVAILFFFGPALLSILFILLYLMLRMLSSFITLTYRLMEYISTCTVWTRWYMSRYWNRGLDTKAINSVFIDFYAIIVDYIRAVWWAGLFGRPKNTLQKTGFLPAAMSAKISDAHAIFNSIIIGAVHQHVVDYYDVFKLKYQCVALVDEPTPLQIIANDAALLQHATRSTFLVANTATFYLNTYNIVRLASGLTYKDFSVQNSFTLPVSVMPSNITPGATLRHFDNQVLRLALLSQQHALAITSSYGRNTVSDTLSNEAAQIKALSGSFGAVNSWNSDNFFNSTCRWVLRQHSTCSALRGVRIYETTTGSFRNYTNKITKITPARLLSLPIKLTSHVRLVPEATIISDISILPTADTDIGVCTIFNTTSSLGVTTRFN